MTPTASPRSITTNGSTSNDMKEIGKALITMRNMVDSFVSLGWSQWDRINDEYKRTYGYPKGPSLSMQSYIGSDLTIDLAYLAKDLEERMSFTNEYWIRAQGIQCIRTEEDREANEKVWHDILGKFKVTKSEDGEITFEWFEDESCQIKNSLLKDGKLYERW